MFCVYVYTHIIEYVWVLCSLMTSLTMLWLFVYILIDDVLLLSLNIRNWAEIGARSLLNLGTKKHLDHQNCKHLMPSKSTELSF